MLIPCFTIFLPFCHNFRNLQAASNLISCHHKPNKFKFDWEWFGPSWSTCSTFLGMMITGEPHVLIVFWIMTASNNLFIMLFLCGWNFKEIAYEADMQGGSSMGIFTGGWVEIPPLYGSLLKMSEYYYIMLSNSFFVSGVNLRLSKYWTDLFICNWLSLVIKSSSVLVLTLVICWFCTLNWWTISLASSRDIVLP